jgi:hypothetical protein
MKKLSILAIFLSLFFTINAQNKELKDIVVANGQMPNLTRDKSNNIHLVFGTGDSIMYASSKNGINFSKPQLVAMLPKLFASAMRGPQIAATGSGIVITAITHNGNIFSYTKESSGTWSKAKKVNDVDEVAKEALMALSADGLHAYAVWLAVKSPKGQNIYGAKSDDGGKTWSKNRLVYQSPDSTVCECCKPSVLVKGNTVYVMYRNWINGNRDMYIVKSVDGGNSFDKANKLGEGSWKLNGCPMDGGGMALNEKGSVETVWRRAGKIYASAPGLPEKEIGEGRGCTIETVNGKNIYAWSENGDVVVLTSNGIKNNVGKGSLPLVKALNNHEVLCVWENEKQIHSSVIHL